MARMMLGGVAGVKRILALWLACYTQEEIAKAVGCGQATVAEVLSEQYQKTEAIKPAAQHLVDFEVPIYNVWRARVGAGISGQVFLLRLSGHSPE